MQFGTYAAEGRRYVPWLRAQLQNFDGVEFRHIKLESLKQVEDFEIIRLKLGIRIILWQVGWDKF